MHALIAYLKNAMMLTIKKVEMLHQKKIYINKVDINKFNDVATEMILEVDRHTSSALKWIAYFSRPNECKKLSTVG